MNLRCVAFLASSAVSAITMAAPDVYSDFSTGTDGWTSAAVNPFDYSVLANGSPRVVNGKLHDTEVLGGLFVFVAPSKFRGDLRPYAGGTVFYNLADQTHNVDPYVNLILRGTNGLAIAYLTAAPTATGRDYNIPLSYAGWVTGPTLSSITDAQFQSVIASVSDFAINGDWTADLHDGSSHTDVLDLGNVRVAAPVPEPSALGALGLAAFALLRRNQKSRLPNR